MITGVLRSRGLILDMKRIGMNRTIQLMRNGCRPSCHVGSASMSGKSKRKITFEGTLGQHLIDIKRRHVEMSEQLIESDKLEVSEIIRISKDCAELSRVVVLIDERKLLQSELHDLILLEKEESSR
jgi:hypothetical protein